MNAPIAPNPGQHQNPNEPHPSTGSSTQSGFGTGPQTYGQKAYGQQAYEPRSFSQQPYGQHMYGGVDPTVYGQRAEEDPGKTLGIISLVATLSTFLGFNFIGPIVGIITGYLARKKSREAGRSDNEMGKWGFVLGIVFAALASLGWLLGISFGLAGGLFSLMAG
jgi:uncharacterized membrane protein